MTEIGSFFAELKRRKVIQTALIYAALAWGAIEVATTLLPVYGASDVAIRLIVAVIIVGLPVAVIVSWMFDFTPGGFRREITPAGEPRAVEALAAPGDDAIGQPPPSPVTPLVGRTAEVEQLVTLVRGGSRVVTITGPGGTGKTRLAIAAATALRSDFPRAVAYVELAAILDANAVVPTIAGALGVKEAGTRSLEAGLATVIGERRVLLVLDNLEQVVEAAPALAALLRACSGLHVLNTSRVPLRLTVETEFPLRPLALPDPGVTPPLEDLATYPAIELFLDRTRRSRAGFRLSSDNADVVLEICRRLDGMPLALELAAARLRTLEPAALLAKLEHALDVLTTGPRDLPARQQTLRATIDWSHSLLDSAEQRVFRRLAVFAGGWTRAAVAPICGSDVSEGAFDSVVEKGLVHTSGPDRFGMYETIREYAVERLAESGEEVAARRRHADHYRHVVEMMYADFRGSRQIESMLRGDLEAANIEAALDHFHDAALSGDAQAAEHGLRMCGDLWMYWHVRGRHAHGRDWSRRFLALPAAAAFPIGRARALVTTSVAATTLGDIATAIADGEEAERLAGGERDLLPLVPAAIAVAHLTAGAIAPAREWLEISVRRSRELGAEWELGTSLNFLGIVETVTGNLTAARSCLEEAASLQRENKDFEGLGCALGGLAALEAVAGRHDEALALYREAFDAYHTVGDRPEEARILDAYAWTALGAGRAQEAREYFVSSLRAYEDVGSVRGIGLALLGLAATEAAQHAPERAVRIAAAAATFSEQEGIANDYAKDSSAPRYLDAARAALDPSEVARLQAEGRALSVRAAVRHALEREDQLEAHHVMA